MTANGVHFDPRSIGGIRDVTEPTNGTELQQFVCAMQWMRNAIPTFSTSIRPLSKFMESIYAKAGSRKKTAVTRVILSHTYWFKTESDAFCAAKDALEHQVTLAHRDVHRRLCVYTDASDFLWSGVVTQIPREDLCKPHVDQRHEPLCFLSGQFTGSSFGWSSLEKEASAIMSTIERMHCLLATFDGFDLFTDHHNLIFISDPHIVVTDLSQSSLRKVLRWEVRLSAYRYTCVHIAGVDNVWFDLFIRWSAPPVVRRLFSVPELPSSSSDDFNWPTLAEIAAAQAQHVDNRPSNLHQEEGIWRNSSNAVFIPHDSTDLQLRLCVITHTGPSGHHGATVTMSVLRRNLFWSTLNADVQTFVAACIHCLSTTGGEKVPRPFGSAVHGTSPQDLVQFDYIEIAPAANNDKYILMLRDDQSDYCWLYTYVNTAAVNAAASLVDWCAAFRTPNMFMSDGPIHFKNDTLRLLAKSLSVKHHFTLPYSPWSNGAIERLGKKLLRVFRAVVSELQLSPEEWPDILPLVQSALNQSPSPQRRNFAPITAFTGAKPTPPISTFNRSSSAKSMTIPNIQRERLLNVVLGARDDFTAGEKLSLRWRGPRRIIEAINDYVYQVEDLRNGELQEIHVTRLKFYHDKSPDEAAIMSHVVNSETGMVVHRLVRLVEDDGELKVQVRWRGLPDSEDTLEPIVQVYRDVPSLFRKLLARKNTPVPLANQAQTVPKIQSIPSLLTLSIRRLSSVSEEEECAQFQSFDYN